MNKTTLSLMGMFVWIAMSVHAQNTKESLWVPTTNQVGIFSLKTGSKIYLTTTTGCNKTNSISYNNLGSNRCVFDDIFETQSGANEMNAVTTISLSDKFKTIDPAFII